MSPSSTRKSFFVRLLTNRHLLTRWVFSGVLLALVVIVAGAITARSLRNETGNSAPSSASVSARALSVVTMPACSAGPAYSSQTYTGIVVARRTSLLASKFVGRIEAVEAYIGKRVEQDDLLIQLDSGQLVAELKMANAELDAAFARMQELKRGPRKQDLEAARARVTELNAQLKLGRANLSRREDLRRSSAISLQEFDESRFQVESQEAQLRSAEQNLALLVEGTREEVVANQAATVEGMRARIQRIEQDIKDRQIVAPYSGIVNSRLVNEGTVVSAGQPLMEFVESAPYEIRVGLPEDYVDDSWVGTTLQHALSVTHNGKDIVATVDRISPTIDQRSRTRDVVFLLSETSSKAVSIGAAVSVTVRKQIKGANALASAALLSENNSDALRYWLPTVSLTAGPRGLWAVFVARPIEEALGTSTPQTSEATHEIELRQVELVRSQGSWSQVQGPIGSDEQLVVRGVHRIVPGQRVTTQPAEAVAADF